MDPAPNVEKSAVHLFNLAHFDVFSPLSSRHALRSGRLAYENGLCYPAPYSHCEHCGVYQIPGLTSSTRIKYAKPSGKRKATRGVPRSRRLHSTCLVCKHTKVETSLLDKRKVPATAPAAGPPGKRKKKRTDLSALLEQKKRAQAAPPTLSLMEFMK